MAITHPSSPTPTTDTAPDTPAPIGLLVGLVHSLAWLVETESVETELMYAGTSHLEAVRADLNTLLGLQTHYPELLPLQATPAIHHANDIITATLTTWDTP